MTPSSVSRLSSASIGILQNRPAAPVAAIDPDAAHRRPQGRSVERPIDPTNRHPARRGSLLDISA